MIDFWNLTRPRIIGMVLAVMFASGWVVAEVSLSRQGLLHAMLGTTAVIAGAIALNQRMECQGDAQMPRTADRPLPTGRISKVQVTCFGIISTVLGAVYLICFSNWAVVLLALASWAVYVLLYTPLKRRSIWQTPVGAAAGAMPALLGAAAVDAPWSQTAWILFGIVFFWQLPHSMAIAWLYRKQFADVGVRVAPVVDPSGKTAGWFAIVGAILLLPVSLAPLACSSSSWICAVLTGILGLCYLFFSFNFNRRRDDLSARRLLWMSLVYLPLVLVVFVLCIAKAQAVSW